MAELKAKVFATSAARRATQVTTSIVRVVTKPCDRLETPKADLNPVRQPNPGESAR